MSESELAQWVGRREERTDWITPSRLAAWNATLDRERAFPSEGDPVPLGLHWALFPPLARASELGEDGHARTGGLLTPPPLPRRLWAGGRLVFRRPLRVGTRVERESVVAAVRDKDGRSGPLVFVTVRHLIADADGVAIEEEQDLVYRGAAGATTASPDEGAARAPVGAWREEIRPSEALLFRYSALTFNSHRIHYDRRYAERVEQYAGLVVHAPLIATLLLDLVERRLPGAELERFHFRAVRPTFDVAPFAVDGAPGAAARGGAASGSAARLVRLWSTDSGGRVAMEAEAWIR